MQQYWGIWSDVALMFFGMAALVLAVGSVWIRGRRLLNEERGRNEHASDRRLDRIEQIVEASAIEVERISESQRYLSKLLADRAGVALGEKPPARINTPH